MNRHPILYVSLVITMTLGVSCGPAPLAREVTPQATSINSIPSASPKGVTESTTPAGIPAGIEIVPVTGHSMQPADIVPIPQKMVDDVESSGTGPEGRAPYGDSYKLSRFERPFLSDMTYVPDIDIHKFGLSEDEAWYYVSIQLLGNDPNNALGIHYGVEIDQNADGFGDYIIWAGPPYTVQWDTSTVQVFQDSDFDSAGISAIQSDPDVDGNGYEVLVFDGGTSQNEDPDLAWVRLIETEPTTIQIAFKTSLAGPAFMLGVVSDAGLKDVSQFDYSDHLIEADAGSPVRSSEYYPLGSLYGVDNTCWEAYGIQATGYEPKACPNLLPVPKPERKERREEPENLASEPNTCPETYNCGIGGTFNTSTCQCE